MQVSTRVHVEARTLDYGGLADASVHALRAVVAAGAVAIAVLAAETVAGCG